MKTYDPNASPDPATWLQLDEPETHRLIARYHRSPQCEHPKAGNQRVHDMIHVIVENQAALGTETPVAATMARLQREGLTRHDAVHAVGTALADLLYNLRAAEADADADAAAEASRGRYYEAVHALTAQDWLSMAEDPDTLSFSQAEEGTPDDEMLDDEELDEADGGDCGDDHCGHHHHAPVTVRRVTPKVGRNEPCPCGSGKKFKKCCLEKAAAE